MNRPLPTKRKNISLRLRLLVLERDFYACQYCGAGVADVGIEIDHLDPVAVGGTNDPWNLVAACASCNSEKATQSVLLFLARRAELGRRIGPTAQPRTSLRRPLRTERSRAFVVSEAIDGRLSFSALRALLVLSITADAEGWCWPNGRQLAMRTGRLAPKISRSLRELERAGYIERHEVSSAGRREKICRLVLSPDELATAADRAPITALTTH